MAHGLNREMLRESWERALAEDGADRDITSEVAIDEKSTSEAEIVARQPGVFAGEPIFSLLKEALGNKLRVVVHIQDGQPLLAGTSIAHLTGPTALLLSIERTLLNFLQRLCGVASLTRQYVDAVAGTEAHIYDTRKTIPLWRQLDKYAVRCGGGKNHRMGLHDAILIKDNHIAGVTLALLADTAADIVRHISLLEQPPNFVEFEVDTLEQLNELLKVTGIDVILLDNFSPAQMREAIRRRDKMGLRGTLQFEASGGVKLDTVREIAATGVERISIGAITHSAPALDLAMDIASQPLR